MNTLQQLKIGGLVVAALVLSQAAWMSDAMAEERADGLRNAGDIGIHLNFLHEPSPSAYGFGVSYLLAPEVRVAASYGALLGNVWGASVKYLPNPDRPVTFVMGLGVARGEEYFSSIFENIFSGDDSDPKPNAYWSVAVSAGIDWQTPSGFQLGVGAEYTQWFISDDWQGALLPYVQIGWLF